MPLVVNVTTYDACGHPVAEEWATREEYGLKLAGLPEGWRLSWI